jgi:hypothetical protein
MDSLKVLDPEGPIREADIAKLRAIISEAIYTLSLTEGSEPLGAGVRQLNQVGVFLFLKLKFLRTNQDHRSAGKGNQRFDHPR